MKKFFQKKKGKGRRSLSPVSFTHKYRDEKEEEEEDGEEVAIARHQEGVKMRTTTTTTTMPLLLGSTVKKNSECESGISIQSDSFRERFAAEMAWKDGDS